MKRKGSFEETVYVKIKKDYIIQKLPDGIIFMIFHYLNYSDLISISKVSKKFHNLEAKFPRTNLNFAEIALFHVISTVKLNDTHIINYFKRINYNNILKVSFKFCKGLTMNSVKLILTLCPKIQELSLEGCSFSYKDVGNILLQTSSENLKVLKLGIKIFKDIQYLPELENYLASRNIQLDIALCINCGNLLVTSLICSFCKKKLCLNCNFTMICSSCMIHECDSCAQGWEICDICGICSCTKSNMIKRCEFCSKVVCTNCCKCMNED